MDPSRTLGGLAKTLPAPVFSQGKSPSPIIALRHSYRLKSRRTALSAAAGATAATPTRLHQLIQAYAGRPAASVPPAALGTSISRISSVRHAAHCADGLNPQALTTAAGANGQDRTTGKDIPMCRLPIHWRWTPRSKLPPHHQPPTLLRRPCL